MLEFNLFEMYNLKEMSLSAEIFLSCSILQLTFYAISTTQQRKHNFVLLTNQIYHVGALIIGLTCLLLFNEDLLILNLFSSNNFIINDYLGFASKLVIGIISVLFLLLTTISYEDKTVPNNFEYVILILISVLGLLLLCSSNDLITSYLAIELQSVAFYLMAAFKKNSAYSIESGLKYFIIGALSSAFFLFGSAIIYGCVGSLNFDDFKMFFSLLSISSENSFIVSGFSDWYSLSDELLTDTAKFSSHFTNNSFELIEKATILTEIFNQYKSSIVTPQTIGISNLNLELVYIGFIFLSVSLFIKLALAPFHFWSLDVYEGSPNTTTVFFAVVPKIALFVLLLRICYSSFYYSFSSNWQSYFLLVSLTSIFVGSVGGLEQRKLKTLLAYSSISHTGYLLLSFSTNSIEGMTMMLYYIVIFMVSSLCFWSIYLFIQHKNNFYYKKHNKELGDLVLLKDSNPMIALILTITLFSIAGIPPIVGFLAKIGIFLVVIKSSAYIIALIGILFSVASTFYYIRIIKILYFENVLVGKLYKPISTKKSLLISIMAILLIVLCIDPTILYFVFQKSSLLY